jgi:hypothetical protein
MSVEFSDKAIRKELATICTYLDAYPHPTGFVDSTDTERSIHMGCVAQGVKIVARHVCNNLPRSVIVRPVENITPKN